VLRKQVILLWTFLLLFFVLAPNVYAAVANDCQTCHAKLDFAAPKIDRLQVCKSCHKQGLHAPTAVSTVYGYYDSINFANPKLTIVQVIYGFSPSLLHSRHSSSAQTANGCVGCHGKLNCTVCHTVGDPVIKGHEPHSTSIYPKTKTFMALGPGSGVRYLEVEVSCINSRCHNSYPGIVSARSDGTQLCLNCHNTPILPYSQGTAKDLTGHDPLLLESSHSSVLPTQLNIGSSKKSVDCSSCHVSSLITEHANKGRDCSVCHNSTNSSVINIVYNSGKLQANRSCNRCHFNLSVIPAPQEHTLFHIATQSNNLTVDGTPHANCNTCHARTTPVTVAVTVNKVVYQKSILELAKMSSKNYSCLGCHNGNGINDTVNPNPKKPVHKADYNGTAQDIIGLHPSCSTCHDQAAVYTGSTRKPADDVNTIISTKNGIYSCTDCHTNLASGHKAYFMYGTERFEMNTVSYHRNCSTCHGNQKVSGIVKTLIGSTTAYDCNRCHNGTAAEAAVHTTVYSEEIVGYHPNSTGSTRCDKCHGEANMAKINILTWPATYDCASCHNGVIARDGYHQARTDVNANPETISTNYHQACTTCHGNSVVQPVINSLKGQTSPYACGQCHSEALGLAPKHQAKFAVTDVNSVAVTGYHIDVTGVVSCGKCHGNPALPAGTISALKAAASYMCNDCHKAGSVIAYKHTASFGTEALNQNTVSYHQACQTCHDSTKAKPVIKSLIGQTGYDCNQCHNGSVTASALHQAKTTTAAVQAANTVSYHPTCATCHSSLNTAVKAFINSNKGVSSAYLCEGCHTGTLAAKHNANWTLAGGIINAFETTQFHVNCDQCHLSSKQAVKDKIGDLRISDTYNCVDCHSGTVAANAKHSASLTVNGAAYESTVFHAKLGTAVVDSCMVCHKNSTVAADLDVIFTKVGAGQGYLCTDCHYGHQGSANGPYAPSHGSTLGNEQLNTVNEHPACTTCHTTAADSKIRSLKGQTGYSCETCHTNIVGKHQSVDNLASTMNMVNCSWCHSSTDPVYPMNNLIGIHLKPNITLTQTYTCNTCHGLTSKVKTQVAANKTACDACHNGISAPLRHPDSQVYPRHVVSPLPTFMPEYSPNCATCHNNGSIIYLVQHRGKNIGCTTCHFTEAYRPAVASLSPDCTGCHNANVSPVSDPTMDMAESHKPFHNANTTLYPATVECLNCHAKDTTFEGQSLLGVHKKNPVSTVKCDSCHAATVRQAVKDAVVANNVSCQACHNLDNGHKHNVTVSGYAYNVGHGLGQVCKNCHYTNSVDKTAELVDVHKNAADKGLITNYDCGTCHNNTAYTTLIGDGTLDMKSNGSPIYCTKCHTGTNSCGSCHAVHGGSTTPTLHKPEHKATGNEKVTCIVCHNGVNVKGNFNAPFGTAVSVASKSLHSSCVICHNTTNSSVQNFIYTTKGKVNAVYQCNVCHDSITPQHNKKHTVAKYLNTGTDTSCAGCHSADVAVLHSATTKATLDCDTCHGTNPLLPNTKPTILANLSNKTANPSFTCESCHTGINAGHSHPVAIDGYALSANVDCSKCHATNADGTAELAAVHQNAATAGKIANYSCATCHNATFEGTVIIKDGNLNMNGIYCTTCHKGAPLAEAPGTKYPAHDGIHIDSAGYGIYQGTFNGQAFNDSGVDCSKCHTSLNTKAVHDPVVHSNVNCNSCHLSSNTAVQAVINGAWSRVTPKASYTCASCHNTLPYLHKPEHIGTSADKAALDCSVCHSTASWTGANAKIVGVHNNNCNICHTSSNATVNSIITAKMGKINTAYSCEGCHTVGGAQTKEVAHKPGHTAKHSVIGMDCASCHTFNLAAGVNSDIKAVHKNGCVTCHGTATRADVKLFISGKLQSTVKPVPAYNCEDCHTPLHVGWEAKHKPTFPTNQQMTCASCHSNDLSTEHLKALVAGVGNIGYKVFRSPNGTTNWTEVGSTTANTFANSGLTANTTYYYKVQAYDGKPNYSGFSSIISAITPTNAVSAATVNPDTAGYATGNNGDTAADPTSTTIVLTKLTDNSNSTYSTVRENSTSDQYVFVQVNKDAKDYSKVELKMSVRYYNAANLIIYPYTTSTAINTAATAYVKGLSNSSSSSYITQTIDVTNAAKTMNGLGWMKFRIKPDPARSASVYIANVQLILTTTPVSGGIVSNLSGTLTANSNDTSAPTVPTGFAGIANYYDLIDLTWTASTDAIGSGAGDTCAVCHSSTVRQQVKDAITANNANCSACHVIHADINTAHTANALATVPWACSKCHSNILSIEHSSGAVMSHNSAMNCDTCHKSTLAKVQAAIKSSATDKSNLKCEACHTGTADGVNAVHSDITAPLYRGYSRPLLIVTASSVIPLRPLSL
jgi:hypothetical protein